MKVYEKRFASSCKVAMTFIGTVVGAGFASGQEVLSFFTVYGMGSFWAILISTFLFIWVGRQIINMGRQLEVRSFSGLINNAFGPFSLIVNSYLLLAFVITSSAMFAGAGALFEEHLSIPFWIGVAITALLAFITILFRVKGLFAINSALVPVLLLFAVSVFIYSLINHGRVLIDSEHVSHKVFHLIKSGISYASYNLTLCIGVLGSMWDEVKDEKALSLGAFLGGAFLGLMLLANNYSLLLHSPDIFGFEIPMMYIVTKMGIAFFIFYSLAIWGSIFTTLIGTLFSIMSATKDLFNMPTLRSSIISVAIALVFSGLGFSYIIGWFYPFLGGIGFIFMVILLWKCYKK